MEKSFGQPTLDSFELNGKAKIQVTSNRMRTFQQIQDFAAEMFNRDKAIKKTYTGESWTKAYFKMNLYFYSLNLFSIFFK